MHYAIICSDAPGSAEKRTALMQAHLQHIEQVLDSSNMLTLAGPLRDHTGAVTGSLLVVDVADAEAARRFIEQDPYHGAGVWREIRIETFSPAAGSWVGGRNW
jgi:uncharacterized protein YciI